MSKKKNRKKNRKANRAEASKTSLKQAPVNASAETPKKALEDVPQKIPAETPVEASKEIPQVIPAEPPVETPAEPPVETPAEPPVEAPAETPAEAPAEVPQEAPEETPQEVPAEAPAEAPAETPAEAPAEVPRETAKEPVKKPAKAKKPNLLWKIVRSVALLLVLLVVGYFAYVFISYHRLPDNQVLEVYGKADEQPDEPIDTGVPYRIVSWNIGFGAYEADYGFFMDGGTQSWAWSEERLDANLKAIGEFLAAQDADLCLIQEIDIDSTRSYHVDEHKILEGYLNEVRVYDQAFAQNYDSPFLFYPLTQPHGASKAGIGTFADFTITSALRRSLPIEKGFTKFLDLDRCYSVSRIPVQNGAELVLYNLHLSAYTSDGTIATEQLRMLLEDMQGEYEAGNYCIAGGDFNKDLLGDSGAYFGASDIEYTWAQPIPAETFDGVDIKLVAPLDEANPVPSCRNADGPYHEGQYVLTIDGFLVSPNVTVKKADVINTLFLYSDHNPVYMSFTLQ